MASMTNKYNAKGQDSSNGLKVSGIDMKKPETRTTLRALYPRQTADTMIYQKAGIQEARNRRTQGLPDLEFKRIKLPRDVPAFSSRASSRANTRSSRKSRSTAASRVSFDDDDSEEEEQESGAFSKAQQAQLEKMFQSLMSDQESLNTF